MLKPDNSFLFPEDTMAELTVPKLMFRRIQKRDGTIVDFDKTKITNAIFAAAESVGGKDTELADSIADLVILYLARTYPDGLLNVEQVQDGIEKVLIENGHARTVKSFILYRAERHRIRQLNKSEIRNPKSEIGSSLQVRTSDEQVIAWNRQRIIDALIRETQLNSEIATRISKEVEIQIIDSNLRIITAGLIRELVNAKLLEHGFVKEQRLHTRLGIPLYDFEQLLLNNFGLRSDDYGVKNETHKNNSEIRNQKSEFNKPIDRILSESFSKQYAFAKVFSQEVVDAHTEGRIYLHGLEEIDKGYQLRFDCRLRNSDCGIKNESRNPHAVIERSLVVSESELTLPAIDTIIEMIKEAPLKIRLVKNPVDAPAPEFVAHKISINLPRFAYLVNQDKTETYLFHLLQSQLELIARAHQQKQQLLNRIYGAVDSTGMINPKSEIRNPKLIYAIGIIGLNEFVQTFTGNQLHQSEAAVRFGIKILSELQRLCRQLSVSFNIPLVLEPTDTPEIASRFAKLDLERFKLLANQVVKKKPTNGGGTYTLGAGFAEDANLDIFERIEAESRLHPYLNNQAYVSIPRTYLGIEIARSGKEWLLSFLKKVLGETNCRYLLINSKLQTPNSK